MPNFELNAVGIEFSAVILVLRESGGLETHIWMLEKMLFYINLNPLLNHRLSLGGGFLSSRVRTIMAVGTSSSLRRPFCALQLL